MHVYNRFKSSEIRCFVNGQVVTTDEIHIQSSKEVWALIILSFNFIRDLSCYSYAKASPLQSEPACSDGHFVIYQGLVIFLLFVFFKN